MLLLLGNVITSSERSEVASMWPHDEAASCGHVLRPIPSLNIVRNQYNNQLQQQEFSKHSIKTARRRDCCTINVLLVEWIRLLTYSDSELIMNVVRTGRFREWRPDITVLKNKLRKFRALAAVQLSAVVRLGLVHGYRRFGTAYRPHPQGSSCRLELPDR